MRKITISLLALALAFGLPGLFSQKARAASISGLVSLVTSPKTLASSSQQTALFSFTLAGNATETLTSVKVQADKANAATGVSGGDLSSLSIYKDDGGSVFNASAANLVGIQTTVNIATTTLITPSTTTPASGKFYVSLATSGSWSGVLPADAITVTLPANAIETSENSPATSALTTAVITADTTGPLLVSATAQNTGGTGVKEAGDSVKLVFSEPTNKPAVSASNINTFFSVNNGHSFLDSSNTLGGAVWNGEGTQLTINLSGASSTTVASIMPGDVVTVAPSAGFTDLFGNQASGTQSVVGSFGSGVVVSPPGNCNLQNGVVVQVTGSSTVYMVVNCVLRPFTTPAVFHAKGKKFSDIKKISKQIFEQLGKGKVVGNDDDDDDDDDRPVILPPAGTSSTTPPVISGLPDGSVVKIPGNPTVYMVAGGVLRPFISLNVFKAHKKSFAQVLTITPEQLAALTVGSPASFPDGSLLKGEDNTVYVVKNGQLYGIPSMASLRRNGYSLAALLRVGRNEIAAMARAGILN